ncbi:MAG: hypothetical protein ACXVGF_04525 [Blastococcus sp.]
MSLAFLILVGWTAVAFVVGTVIGWSIRDADHRELAVEFDDLTALVQAESIAAPRTWIA